MFFLKRCFLIALIDPEKTGNPGFSENAGKPGGNKYKHTYIHKYIHICRSRASTCADLRVIIASLTSAVFVYLTKMPRLYSDNLRWRMVYQRLFFEKREYEVASQLLTRPKSVYQ